MTDNEMELFSELAQDEGFAEAAKLHMESTPVSDHEEDDDDNCPPCVFKRSLFGLLAIGAEFTHSAHSDDEDGLSPLDLAIHFVDEGARDGLPLIGMISDAIETLNSILSAVSYHTWQLERAKNEWDEGECDCGHDHE